MATLSLLWWASLAFLAIALSWMAGLILARLVRARRNTARAAARQAVARAYLKIMAGDAAAQDLLAPFQHNVRLLAESLLEVLALVRGTERQHLVRAMQALGIDERLRKRLGRGSLTGRRAAAEALSAFPSDGTKAALERVCREASDSQLRIAAVRSLIEIDAAPAPQALIADLERRREAESLMYVPIFRQLAVAQPDAMLAAFQADGLRPSTRAVVAEALGAGGDYRAVAALIDQARAADLVVRAAVIRALGMLGHPGAVDVLVEALDDPDWDVRAEACVAAGRMKSDALTGRLRRALADPEWWVRFRAAEALLSMGKAGVETLQIEARSAQESVRSIASLALAERGLVA